MGKNRKVSESKNVSGVFIMVKLPYDNHFENDIVNTDI